MNSQQALQSILDFNNTRKSANDYLSTANTQYGVTDAQSRAAALRSSINNTTNLIAAVPDSVSGRTQGSLVSDAQRTRLVGMEQAPLSGQLATQQGAYGVADQDLKDARGLASTYASNAYGADSDKLAALNTTYGNLKAKEDADREYQQWLQGFQEQQRQFNETISQQKAAAASALSGLGKFNTPATASKPDAFSSVDKQGATNSILAMLKTGDINRIRREISAINASAGYGNNYDKYKVQLIQQYMNNSQYGALINKAIQGNVTVGKF